MKKFLIFAFVCLGILNGHVQNGNASDPAQLKIISNWKHDIVGVYVAECGDTWVAEWSHNLLRRPVKKYGGVCIIKLRPGRYNIRMKVGRKDNQIIEHGINTTRGNRGLYLAPGQTFVWSMD